MYTKKIRLDVKKYINIEADLLLNRDLRLMILKIKKVN